jgi:hypothetical protein
MVFDRISGSRYKARRWTDILDLEWIGRRFSMGAGAE